MKAGGKPRSNSRCVFPKSYRFVGNSYFHPPKCCTLPQMVYELYHSFRQPLKLMSHRNEFELRNFDDKSNLNARTI